MKRITIAAFIALGTFQVNAQDYSISEGGTVEMEKQKDSEVNNFTAGGTHYYITRHYKSPSTIYNMQSVAVDGSEIQSSELSVPVGEFGNSFSISSVIGLGDQAYAIVENYNSQDNKRVLSARKMTADGSIEASGNDIMMINFEKMLRPGRLMTATSPDGSHLVAVGVLSFNKKESRKFKVAVYDASMNEISSSEITLDGLAIKNARFETVIANDGTVYVNRYTAKMKDGIKILVHEYSPKSAEIENTYLVEAAADDVMGNYMHATNNSGELVVAAAFKKDVKVYTGDEEQSGIFIFRNEGKSNGIIEYNDLDTPAPNFELTGIHITGEIIYVTGEDAKMEKNSPAETTPTTANSTFTFTHGNEYILGFNPSGKKMFELLIDLSMSARTTKHSLYSASHIIDGELVYIFNDQFSKYRDTDDIASGGTIPVAVNVDATGLMTPAVPFMNDLKMTNGYVLLPNYSAVSGNTVTLLARDRNMLKSVSITAE
ncbi:hypothetical protein N9355_03900 [Crocinitomicaceae bacterium]|nr:hypothetical protein [Crocinitomicaceae bacterium]